MGRVVAHVGAQPQASETRLPEMSRIFSGSGGNEGLQMQLRYDGTMGKCKHGNSTGTQGLASTSRQQSGPVENEACVLHTTSFSDHRLYLLLCVFHAPTTSQQNAGNQPFARSEHGRSRQQASYALLGQGTLHMSPSRTPLLPDAHHPSTRNPHHPPSRPPPLTHSPVYQLPTTAFFPLSSPHPHLRPPTPVSNAAFVRSLPLPTAVHILHHAEYALPPLPTL